MRHQVQLVRVKAMVAKKLTMAQLLLSIQREMVLTKSQALNVLLDEFLCNHSINNKE